MAAFQRRMAPMAPVARQLLKDAGTTLPHVLILDAKLRIEYVLPPSRRTQLSNSPSRISGPSPLAPQQQRKPQLASTASVWAHHADEAHFRQDPISEKPIRCQLVSSSSGLAQNGGNTDSACPAEVTSETSSAAEVNHQVDGPIRRQKMAALQHSNGPG